MGKYRNNLAGRLSGLNEANNVVSNRNFNNRKDNRINQRIDASRLKFKPKIADRFNPKLDARLQLIQNAAKYENRSKITDARELLLKRQQNNTNENNSFSSITKTNDANKKEPIVIVTGLGNVRREGSHSVRVLKRPESPANKRLSHHVVSDGLNTLVTLTNDLATVKSKQNKNKDYDILHDDNSHSSSSKSFKNYEPIRIKITNSSYETNKSSVPILAAVPYNNSSNITLHNHQSMNSSYKSHMNNSSLLFNKPNYENNNYVSYSNNQNNSPDSMDFESNYSVDKSMFNRIGNSTFNGGTMYSSMLSSSSSNNNNNNNFTNKTSSSFFNTNNNSIIAEVKEDYFQGLSHSAKDGYKLLISNLHPRVTEDDVLELFSDIGPIKRARFIDKGLAEVTYVRLEHAKEAIQKYDQKELDGRQMVIGFAEKSLNELKEKVKKPLTTSSSLFMSSVQSVPQTAQLITSSSQPIRSNSTNLLNTGRKFDNTSETPVSTTTAKDTLSNRFKTIIGNKDSTNIQLPESKKHDINNKVAVDNSIIHQVLFNKKPALNTNPVTFTVKL